MDGDRLDEEQIAMVIRRASELDGQTLPGEIGMDLAVLEQAAVEAGLSRESVRRAVAELRAGTLPAEGGAGPGRRRARLSPATVTVSRCVPGPAAEVNDILHRFLAKELFHLRRDFGSRSNWSRRQDVGARVRMSYDKSIHRRLRLRDAEHLEIAAVEEPGSEGRLVLVKISVDVRSLRRVHHVATGKGAAVGVVAALGGLAWLGSPEALLLVPVTAGAGIAAGHAIGSSRYRSRIGDMETALEGFLDGIERRPS